jgi:hypothetical protein
MVTGGKPDVSELLAIPRESRHATGGALPFMMHAIAALARIGSLSHLPAVFRSVLAGALKQR